ncbi:MAG: alpha/beta hydrolase-fold protein [Thermoanaerobaculia bacterium]
MRLRLPTSALAIALLTASGCLRLRAPATPMGATDVSPAPAPSAPCLVVFLPGRRDSPGAYRRHRFAEMAAQAGVSARFLEADAHLGYYQAQTISGRLETDIVGPARAAGARRIWIVGISMGGLGGLLMAREHPDLHGVLALAPFLGDTEPGLVAGAGGLASWKPGPPRPVADYERELWGWLKTYTSQGAARPPVYVGFGLSDDLAPANRLLGDSLPAGRVFTEKGAHNWGAWTALWKQFLAAGALQRDCPLQTSPAGQRNRE